MKEISELIKVDKSMQKQRITLERALKDARGTANIDNIKKALEDIIIFHQKQFAFDQCIIYCCELVHYFQDPGQENELADKWVFMGTCYLRLSDYGKAEESYGTALGLFQKIDNYFGCAEANVNLGRISQSQGQLEKAWLF